MKKTFKTLLKLILPLLYILVVRRSRAQVDSTYASVKPNVPGQFYLNQSKIYQNDQPADFNYATILPFDTKTNPDVDNRRSRSPIKSYRLPGEKKEIVASGHLIQPEKHY